jgi:hypothetical protein
MLAVWPRGLFASPHYEADSLRWQEVIAVADHYDATVNRGSLNMGSFTKEMNKRWDDGWQVAQVFMQEGNTIVIWERRSG